MVDSSILRRICSSRLRSLTKDDHLISIEMAPSLEAGKTLVPLSFFREIAEINISDEQIIINGS
jgi:hypothetical protein